MTLAVHNAIQLTDEDVRDRFVVRSQELEELLTHLREDDPPRHALVIGQRGMGKSLLVRRVAVEVVDDADLAARWLPVVMPEELYEVTSTGELWLAALDRLAKAEGDAELAEQHAALLGEPDPDRMANLALQRLLGAGRARNRKVLLLAENLHMLLDDQVAADEGWALRQALQTEPDLLLMATAVTTFRQVEDAGEAFFGFFHRIDLRPLGDDDVRALWHKVTGVHLAGDRIIPIRILTGGNPRLVAVLGRFSAQPDLGSLREDLELLIDEYTPYFKANIEGLPPIERKVFVTLADIWAPATAAEVAAKARMTSSQVSALLGRLVRRGAVHAVEQERGRQRYEVTERLYNLYHLLRRSGGEGRVRALVDILLHLYGPAELERDVLPRIVGFRSSPIDASVASGVNRHLDLCGVWDYMPASELNERRDVFQSLLATQRAALGDDHRETLLTRNQIAYVVGRNGDSETAVSMYEEVLADQARLLGPDDPDTLSTRREVAHYIGDANPRRAVELLRDIVADCSRALSPDDRCTLRSRHSLAYFTGIAGDKSGSREAFTELAGHCERILGADHPDTLTNRSWVAYYADAVGDVALAHATATDVLRRAETALPQSHPVLLAARALHNIFAFKFAAASGTPLPRELFEAISARTGL